MKIQCTSGLFSDMRPEVQKEHEVCHDSGNAAVFAYHTFPLGGDLSYEDMSFGSFPIFQHGEPKDGVTTVAAFVARALESFRDPAYSAGSLIFLNLAARVVLPMGVQPFAVVEVATLDEGIQAFFAAVLRSMPGSGWSDAEWVMLHYDKCE